jgi:hypothetical protein
MDSKMKKGPRYGEHANVFSSCKKIVYFCDVEQRSFGGGAEYYTVNLNCLSPLGKTTDVH